MDKDESQSLSDQEKEESHRRRWINRGFDPDVTIHEFFGCFSLDDAKASLFGSTYSRPIPVYLTNEDENTRIPLVITKAEAHYVTTPCGVGREEHPDWYFEGWVPPSGFDPAPQLTWVRIFVCTRGNGIFEDDDMFEWQHILNKSSS